MFAKQEGGGTPHIPIEGIWSDIQARVGTPHKILKCWKIRGGHRTYHLYNEMKDRRVMAGWLAGWVAGWLDGSVPL